VFTGTKSVDKHRALMFCFAEGAALLVCEIRVSLHLALERNSARIGADRVADEVIVNMATKFEHVEESGSSASHGIVIDGTQKTPDMVSQLVHIIQQPTTWIPVPCSLEEDAARNAERERVATSLLHQCDLHLRKLVGAAIKHGTLRMYSAPMIWCSE
jgi:hypothetical protein